MGPMVLFTAVEIGGGTEFLPSVSFSEFDLINPFDPPLQMVTFTPCSKEAATKLETLGKTVVLK